MRTYTKFLALLLGAALCLTACGKKEAVEATPESAAETAAPATPTPEPSPTPAPATPVPTATAAPALDGDLLALVLPNLSGQWGGVSPDGTAWVLSLENGQATLQSQAPDAAQASTVASLSLSDLSLDDLSQLQLGDYTIALVPDGDGYALRIDDLYLTSQNVSDPARLLEDLRSADELLTQLETDNFWMACVGSDLYSLQLTEEGLTLTCYTEQDGTVNAQTLTGTFTLDADGLQVVDADGAQIFSFGWDMIAEEDALDRLELSQTLDGAAVPAGETFSFYATEVTDAEEADAMARAYLENRQTPDPATDDLTTLLSGYRGVSIVDACILHGLDPSLENRAIYAEAFGIENYRGTAEQNLFLLTSMGGVIE